MNNTLPNLKPAGGYNTPLQQLFLLEERVRRVGATLPEDINRHRRFHGIKCNISGINCLIDIRRISEVIEERHVTPVPGSANWVEGIMNFRGALVPVYNTQRFLASQQPSTLQNKGTDGPLLVMRYGNELCAMRVNKVLGMQKCLDDDFYQIGSSTANPDSIKYYAKDSIDIETELWCRVDIARLLDVITQENTRALTAEPTETN